MTLSLMKHDSLDLILPVVLEGMNSSSQEGMLWWGKKFISVLTRKFDSLAIIFCKKKVKLDSKQLPVYS